MDGSLPASSSSSSSGSDDAVVGLRLSSSAAASRSEKLTRLAFWSRCMSEGDLWLAALDAGPFSARRMRSSHLRTGALSSAPSTFPAFSGTISWNL